MNIGIICYASVGGSGIVATELGKALARPRPPGPLHQHGDAVPAWRATRPGLSFHQVMTPTYPLFREPQYLLSLANKIVQVAREFQLDVIHAHYAIPHATAAFLSRQVLASGGHVVPRVVTTLHGTDITLVGSDPSYSEIVAFSIEQSDGVTAVSESLREATRASSVSGATSRSSRISSTATSTGAGRSRRLRQRFAAGRVDASSSSTSRTSGR